MQALFEITPGIPWEDDVFFNEQDPERVTLDQYMSLWTCVACTSSLTVGSQVWRGGRHRSVLMLRLRPSCSLLCLTEPRKCLEYLAWLGFRLYNDGASTVADGITGVEQRREARPRRTPGPQPRPVALRSTVVSPRQYLGAARTSARLASQNETFLPATFLVPATPAR